MHQRRKGPGRGAGDQRPPALRTCLVANEPGQEDQADHGHQLDQDVEGGAGGVLEGVTHGVADHSSFVSLAALAAFAAVLNELLALSQTPPALDMKMAIMTPVTSAPPSMPPRV
jgi:hypothetical protein